MGVINTWTPWTPWVVALVVVSSFPCGAAPGKHKVESQIVNNQAVWKPSLAAIGELAKAASSGSGTRELLLRLMNGDHATEASILFSNKFPHEAVYLSAINPPSYSDGFTVGEVRYPFRGVDSKSFMILNANPKAIDVSDPQLLRLIDIASSRDFLELCRQAVNVECLWNKPCEFEIQPGLKNQTDVRVSYPIRDKQSNEIIGKVYVLFEFSFPGRKYLGTRLDFLEKVNVN